MESGWKYTPRLDEVCLVKSRGNWDKVKIKSISSEYTDYLSLESRLDFSSNTNALEFKPLDNKKAVAVTLWHKVFTPRIEMDLYGELEKRFTAVYSTGKSTITGCGSTPAEAVRDFDRNFEGIKTDTPKPVFTKTMEEMKMLPPVGAECVICFPSGNHRVLITYMGEGVGCYKMPYDSNNLNKEFTFDIKSVSFKAATKVINETAQS